MIPQSLIPVLIRNSLAKQKIAREIDRLSTDLFVLSIRDDMTPFQLKAELISLQKWCEMLSRQLTEDIDLAKALC